MNAHLCPECGASNPSHKAECQECGASLTATTTTTFTPKNDGGFFADEKKGVEKGVVGGLTMIIIAVIWFAAGYEAGYIFYYPPILFIIGVYAVIKGLATGNLSGNRRRA